MLVLLATLPAILFTFYIANNERNAALQRMEEDARHMIKLVSREHFYQVSGAKTLLLWLAGRLSLNRYAEDPEFLAALLAGYPQLANIAVLSGEGNVLSSAFPLPVSLNMQGYDAVQRALLSSDIETGAYVIGPIVKKPIFHLAYAVRNAAGDVRRVIFVAVDLGWLNRLTNILEFETDYLFLTVDREGRVLSASAQPSEAAVFPGTLIPELSEQARKGKDTVTVTVADGKQPLVLADMEGLHGITAGFGIPYKYIYRKADRVFYRLIGWLSLFTAFTVVLVLLFEEVVLIRYLRGLSTSMRRFGKGAFKARAAVPRGHGELQEMARTFNNMAETLAARHEELQQANDLLDSLTRRLHTAREEEAKRIARDLHDEVGQILTSLKIDVSAFKKICQSCVLKDRSQESLQESISAICAKIDGSVDFIRRIASQLRPPVLDKVGLVAAVKILAAETEKNDGPAVEVNAEEKCAEKLSWIAATALYRIVQEALTNIVRYAGAELVEICLFSENETTVLTIRDDGRGFDMRNPQRETLGIAGMRERAHLVGGTFLIDSRPGKGTSISVSVPYSCAKGEDDENTSG